MVIKINAGVWTGAIILAFSLVLFLQSFAFSYSGPVGPGPGFFPIWLSGILGVLSLIYIVISIKKGQQEKYEFPTVSGLKNILLILIYMIAFVLLLPYVGFVLSGTLFLFILISREYKWYSSLAIGLGASLFIFWVFGSVLSISLPINFLGF